MHKTPKRDERPQTVRTEKQGTETGRICAWIQPIAGASRRAAKRAARLSREEIESALRQPSASAAPEPVAGVPSVEETAFTAAIDLPAWEPPADLDGAIASFNARHVVLFRAMRAEIGAGAANFVRSCRGALDAHFAELFATADLRADGSWDPDGLKRSIVEHRIANAVDGFATLLEGELHRLRTHMGEKRATALAEQLTAIQ